MTVEALIDMLQSASPDAEVKIFDPNSGEIEGVTGMTYGQGVVELFSDDID